MHPFSNRPSVIKQPLTLGRPLRQLLHHVGNLRVQRLLCALVLLGKLAWVISLAPELLERRVE